MYGKRRKACSLTMLIVADRARRTHRDEVMRRRVTIANPKLDVGCIHDRLCS